MIAQWENEWIPLSMFSVARVQFPAVAKYFKGFFSGWSHSANPSWASVTGNRSISPQCHHTSCGHRGGRLTSADRKWLKDKTSVILLTRRDSRNSSKSMLPLPSLSSLE